MKTIREFVDSKETEVFKFKPNKSFYKAVGINYRRWALIYRDEIEPVFSEIQRIADYFKVDIMELIDLKPKSHE
jgi:hypothetical protein